MTLLLDTDTCVHWLRGNEAVQRRILAIDLRYLHITPITVMELRYGAACSSKPEANAAAVDAFTDQLQILGIDMEVTRTFARIKTELRRQGLLIEDFDLVNAAAAFRHDLVLVTNNVRHFNRIPTLRIDSWT